MDMKSIFSSQEIPNDLVLEMSFVMKMCIPFKVCCSVYKKYGFLLQNVSY